MKILEIAALENGAHRNQSGTSLSVPEGWARIPDDMTLPDSFPFVDIVAEAGLVTSMTAAAVPEPEPVEPVDPEPSEAEDTAAMLVDHEYRLTLLELGLTE